MTTTTMAIAIFTPTYSSSSSSSSSSCRKIPPLFSFSSSAISIPKNAIFQHIKCVPHLGLTPFSQWDGLKNMGVSISRCTVKMGRKGKRKGKGVYASLFGVGAPEVLVIGVVALLVFGPKGLAEVARNLGKTLRAFQPTIRELQEVSREFKSTLEREIGLDDIDSPVPKRPSDNTTPPIDPNGSSPEAAEDPADISLKMRADQFKGALAQLQKEQEEEKKKEEEEKLESQFDSQAISEDTSDAPETSEAPVTSEEAPVTSEAPDTVEESSSVTPPSENADNVLQESAAGVPASSAANTETQS